MMKLEGTDIDKLAVSELTDNSTFFESTHQGMEGVALEPEIRYDIPNCGDGYRRTFSECAKYGF